MARDYERSPRQRFEWFGGRTTFALATGTANRELTTANEILVNQPRATITAGNINEVAFPAGIVRGETCSIARFIGSIDIYDKDRRQQNISYELAAGLIKVQVEDDIIADPTGSVQPVQAPDALEDLRASWIWHGQNVWNPQSAGANYTVLSWNTNVDSTNSRIFESNDVLMLNVQCSPLENSATPPVALDCRVTLLWRCLLRLD